MPAYYADIAIPVSVDKLFTYVVPEFLTGKARQGMRVLVPFGNRTLIGIIIEVKDRSDVKDLKQIKDILDTDPLIPQDLLNLSKWISDYYFSGRGEVLKSLLIPGAMKIGKRMVRLNQVPADLPAKLDKLSKLQLEIIGQLQKKEALSFSQLQKILSVKNIYPAIRILEQKGIINIRDEKINSPFNPKTEAVIAIDSQARERIDAWTQELLFREGSRKQKQINFLQKLLSFDPGIGFIPLSDILKSASVSSSVIKTLQKKNILKIESRELIRAQEFDLYRSALGKLDITLNNDQETALKNIEQMISDNRFHTFLLHGVTGSGKTQVYIESIKKILGKGKTAIVLVPEISLTPQIIRRFKYHFKDKVTVIHSRMSDGERGDAWRLSWEGRVSVVIGPRSAIFAPLKNLGLIIVDEEHESSYKQFDQLPRYHARDVAIMRGSFCNAVVVLGSATPSLESYNNAIRGKYTLLELPERVDNAKFPKMHLIDMAEEHKKKVETYRTLRKEDFKTDKIKARLEKRTFETSSLSDFLREKIKDRLNKKEGIILLQNRRGFAPFIECPSCGYVEMCGNCNISLTYHSTGDDLRCHYCGTIKRPPLFCPTCRSADIRYRGFGTQRVETELAKLFPAARLLRMDLDTTSLRGSHDKYLKQFSEGEADILLGTQMVAKGLDFPRVTLVGVISADTQMLLPDFRSAERTFQLLTQVAGRAGRSNLEGEVVIQTYQVHHTSLKYVMAHDYKGFYDQEIAYRNELNYPPMSRIILLEFRSKDGSEIVNYSTAFTKLLKQNSPDCIILGPAPAALVKLKNYIRWHTIIKIPKSSNSQSIHAAVRRTLETFRRTAVGKSRSVKLTVDVDPIGMM